MYRVELTTLQKIQGKHEKNINHFSGSVNQETVSDIKTRKEN